MTDKENALEKMGLEVKTESLSNLEIGKVYPIYGMVTKFISETPGDVRIEVNYNMELTLFIDDLDKINTIKERAFEPGIFIVVINEIDAQNENHYIKGNCNTVVFGRKQTQLHS